MPKMERKSAEVQKWEGKLKAARDQLKREENLWLPGSDQTGKHLNETFNQFRKNLELMHTNIDKLHRLEIEPLPEDPEGKRMRAALIEKARKNINSAHEEHERAFNSQPDKGKPKETWLF